MVVNSVIVTVKAEELQQELDFELPADEKVSVLAEMIARALKLDWFGSEEVSYTLKVDPAGSILNLDDTLSGCGVWDGSLVTLLKNSGSS